MLPDRVSNPGPLTYELGALPIVLRGPALFLTSRLVWMSPFLVLGVSYRYSHFHCILLSNSCKKTVLILIKCHVLRHLNWVCTVCICPPNRFPAFKRLKCIVTLPLFIPP